MPRREMVNVKKVSIGQHVFFIQLEYILLNGDE
jgi:hypothetical protein